MGRLTLMQIYSHAIFFRELTTNTGWARPTLLVRLEACRLP